MNKNMPHTATCLLLNIIVALAKVLQELIVGLLHIASHLLAVHQSQGTQSELQSHGTKLELEDNH